MRRGPALRHEPLRGRRVRLPAPRNPVPARAAARFAAQFTRPTADRPGTYGFLLGDAANAIHFWPGRGLNSGLASAVSLVRSLSRVWRGRPLRDADFIRREAAMSMLRYRHKSRAWNAMVTTDERGVTRAIEDVIESSLESAA
ncbi:FAD-dependent monooxygenase family protein [Streptomyces olivaceoviridis]|uniref:hypothetical protein n=1 Tax=Streptomyces olivaceoviridis TaxID=1921 RepID=UPI00368230F1